MTIWIILTAKNARVQMLISRTQVSGAEHGVWLIRRLHLSKNFVSNLAVLLVTLHTPTSLEVKSHWNKFFR